MKTRPFLAATIAGIATIFATASPAWSLRSITSGHVDVLDVDYAGGNLTLNIRDDTVTPVNDNLNPASVKLHALPASQTTVPNNPSFSFLGAPGSAVWILPQTQNPALLWPGWDTAGVPNGQLQNNQVRIRMVSVTGPGNVSVYTVNALGTPTVRYNSGDGLPDTMTVARNVHGHGNWAFTAAGTYSITFEATATTTGGVAKSSGLKVYTFVVGS